MVHRLVPQAICVTVTEQIFVKGIDELSNDNYSNVTRGSHKVKPPYKIPEK